MMKRCPECYEVYDPEQNYCENDGQTLLADPTLSLVAEDDLAESTVEPQPPAQAWFTGVVGLMAGILICVCFYVGYSLLMIENDPGRQESSVTDRTDPNSFQRDRRPAPSDEGSVTASTEEPSEDGDAEDASEAVVQEPSPTTDSKVAVRLNLGPVSTGDRGKNDGDDATVRTIIEMTDGTEADVDAAWEDSKGVWYRRGGVVSFVESNRVKAIIARAETKPSP